MTQHIDITAIMNESYARKPLASMLPLSTPLGIDFHPTTACNIKCIFCLHSSYNQVYNPIKNQYMPLDLVKKCIDDMKDFPNKVKALHFCGLGEPLLHKDIVAMIDYACQQNIAEKIDINTNGVLLHKKNVDALVNTGVDFIRISVNGLCDEDFAKYTGARINFKKYVQNLKYLFKNKKKTNIYIKTFSFMVDTPEKKDFFLRTFEPICDSINVEHYRECFVDTQGKNQLSSDKVNQRGEVLNEIKVCSQPFFKLEIKPNGDCAPCAEAIGPIILGNAQEQSLFDIWHGGRRKKFCKKMLDGLQHASAICKSCTFVQLCSFKADSLDQDAPRLKVLYAE